MNDNVNASTVEQQMEQDFVINDVTPENVVNNIVNDDVVSSSFETSQTTENSPKNDVSICDNNSEEDKTPSESAVLMSFIKENFSRLENKFDNKIAEDVHKNALFDKMYDELASYKKDLYAKLVGPFVNETISLLDDYERLVERIDSIDYEKLKKYILGVPEDLESILDNNGVERYSDDVEKFNPKTQRVIKTIPVGNMELDNVIVERTRKGYRWNGVMLKPEMVKIYKYKEGLIEPTPEIRQNEQNQSTALETKSAQ